MINTVEYTNTTNALLFGMQDKVVPFLIAWGNLSLGNKINYLGLICIAFLLLGVATAIGTYKWRKNKL